MNNRQLFYYGVKPKKTEHNDLNKMAKIFTRRAVLFGIWRRIYHKTTNVFHQKAPFQDCENVNLCVICTWRKQTVQSHQHL